MGQLLELYDARVSFTRATEGNTEVHFSYAHIHGTIGKPGRDTGQNWTQEAVLILCDTTLSAPPPSLPDSISDGYLEHDGKRIELIPLPFERTGDWRLHLRFTNGTSLDIHGTDPVIKLKGEKVFLKGI